MLFTERKGSGVAVTAALMVDSSKQSAALSPPRCGGEGSGVGGVVSPSTPTPTASGESTLPTASQGEGKQAARSLNRDSAVIRAQLSLEQSRGVIFFSVAYLAAASLTIGSRIDRSAL